MNSIKNSSIILCLVIGTLASAQIFDDSSESVLNLNSPYGEDFITLNPSGNEIFFSRLNHPYNQGGKQDAGDIWRCSLVSDKEIPSNWHELNTEYFSSPVGFSNDGSAFIFNKVSIVGGALNTELWVSSKGQKQKLDVKYFKNKSSHQSGCLSVDNRHMIISMESGATYGVEDLYVLVREQDGWSAPKNLGQQINSEFQEITPFLSSNNTTLYFATNGRDGEGSFDIYKSERLDDSWRNWSIPENLGPEINSRGRETSFTFLADSQYAYFISTQNSDGYGDIKRIKFRLDSNNQPLDSDTTEFIQTIATVATNGMKFVNAKNSEPITSKIRLTSNNGNMVFDSDTYGIVSLDSSIIGEVDIQGFMPTKVQTYKDSLVVFRMEPLEVGRIIQLEHVLFGRASANILESSFDELNIVVKMMKRNPEMRILLKGHTDGNGDLLQNKKLSEARVNEVIRYLKSKGINKKRIEGIGVGGLEPIASNETEATRKLNRRVEFVIVK